MVDTVRTQAELLAFLHPNIANAMPDATVLVAQAARDLIVSIPTLVEGGSAFFPNGPDASAIQAVFGPGGGSVPASGPASRFQVMEGSPASPVIPSGTTLTAKPTMLISRNVKPDPGHLVGDPGALYVQLHGFDNGTGIGLSRQPQVNGMQMLIDQHAPTDAMGVSSQVAMNDPRSGTGYGFYTNVQLVSGQVVTISHASPAVVSWPGHGQTVDVTQIRLGTSGTLPAPLTAGTQYGVSGVIDANSFYISLPTSMRLNNVASIDAVNPGKVHTIIPHGLSTGASVRFEATTTTPNINGVAYSITVTGPSDFTIPVNITSGQAGAAGDYSILLNTTTNGSGTHKAWADGGMVAMNPLIANTSGVDFTYDGFGTMIMTNLMLQAIYDGVGAPHLAGSAMLVGPGNNLQWDTGIAFYANSIATQTFVDDSSAATSLKVRGTHATGIDLSGATITGVHVRWDANFVQGLDGSGNPYVQFDSGDFISYNRATNIYGLQIGGVPVTAIGLDGSNNPYVQFDTADFISYNRATNTYGLVIGGVAATAISGGIPGAGNTNVSILQGAGPTLSQLKYSTAPPGGANILYF